MTENKLQLFLSANGVNPGEEALAQYGVKGMKWGKNKTIEELQAEQKALEDAMAGRNKKPFEPLLDTTIKTTTTNYPGKGEITRTSSTKTYQGKANKFVEDLFDHKKNVKVGQGDFTVSKTQQGKVNKFIEGAFKKLTNPFSTKTTSSRKEKVTSITGADGTKYDPKTLKPIKP